MGPAVIEVRLDGTTHMSDECMCLVFGISEAEAARYTSGGVQHALPDHVIRKGYKRRRTYKLRQRTRRDPNALELLLFWARRDGVELVYIGPDGARVTLVEKPGGGART